MSEPFTGANVRAGLQQSPETPDTFLEHIGADGSFPGGDPFS
jgi:hypothetical protein